jgi:hypothetical protein
MIVQTQPNGVSALGRPRRRTQWKAPAVIRSVELNGKLKPGGWFLADGKAIVFLAWNQRTSERPQIEVELLEVNVTRLKRLIMSFFP